MAHYLAPCPWVVRSMAGVNHDHALLAHLDLQLADLIGLVVSQDNSCRFCYAAQSVLLRIQGFPDQRIRELQQDLLSASIGRRESSALEFARRFSRASPLLAWSDTAAMREAGWSDAAIREIAVVAATHVYFNRLSTLPALPPASLESMPDRWWFTLAAPLVRRWMRKGRGAPVRLAPGEEAGPFGALVEGLDGLPAARAMRRVLDDAFASPLLSRAAKSLIFAVVARGLGSPVSESEASRLLDAEGWTPADVETALAHLASPRLDPAERALLPVARESIRYEPARIQRHARGLRETLGVQRFVEFVGTCALANAVCRLDAVVAR
jgi:AhpD family alkylhydroperoxidase